MSQPANPTRVNALDHAPYVFAMEYAAFVLPSLAGWLLGSHMLPFAAYTAYWAMHRAGLQSQYKLWLGRQAERYRPHVAPS